MGKAKKTRKYAEVKRLISPKDLKQLRLIVGGCGWVCAGPRQCRRRLAAAKCLPYSALPALTTHPLPTRTHPHRAAAKKQQQGKKGGAKKEDDVRHVYVFHFFLSPARFSSLSDPTTPHRPPLLPHNTTQPNNSQKVSTALFFKWNSQLGPPYQVLVDTNFINFSIKNKIDLVQGMMDCLYAQCTPCVTDCVLAELEKLGPKYRVALKVAKDPRLERLPCSHAGTYADDCLVQRVSAHKCYIVATCDKDLRRRIRKVPGVPIMYLAGRRYTIERLPEATMGGAPRR
jgi:U3 small nucleolar RNA-associated protein 24